MERKLASSHVHDECGMTNPEYIPPQSALFICCSQELHMGLRHLSCGRRTVHGPGVCALPLPRRFSFTQNPWATSNGCSLCDFDAAREWKRYGTLAVRSLSSIL